MVRILFYSPNEGTHPRVANKMRAGLEQLLNIPVEITQKFSSKEAMDYVTDHVVDLVLMGAEDTENWARLAKEIKELDRTIPVIVLGTHKLCNGRLSETLSHTEIRKIAAIIRPSPKIAATR